MEPYAASLVQEVLSSPGQPLERSIRDPMETRFAQDFSNVRIHTGASAAASARAVGAVAYTVGRDIVFGGGGYLPATNAGRRTLAHELTHVVQQRVSPPVGKGHAMNFSIGGLGDPLESEAETVAGHAAPSGHVPGGIVPPVGRTAPGSPGVAVLQRQPVPAASSPGAGGDVPQNASPSPAPATPVIASVTLARFAAGQAELSAADRVLLHRTAQDIVLLLSQRPRSIVRVTRQSVSDQASGLASRRAEAVRKELIGAGVAEGSIVTETSEPMLADASAKSEWVQVHFEPRGPMRGSPLPVDVARRINLFPRRLPPGGPAAPNLFPVGVRPTGPISPAQELEQGLAGLIQHSRLPEDSTPHPALDASTGNTAMAPPGVSPTTYTVTIIWRNASLLAGPDGTAIAVDVLKEPNFSVQFSPDLKNAQVYQAAVALVNLHLRWHGRELIELSVSPTLQASSSGALSGGLQTQAEVHLTSRFSLIAQSTFGAAPHDDTGAVDFGSVPLGTRRGLDVTWTPLIGTVIHF